jgi:hypothetical protein
MTRPEVLKGIGFVVLFMGTGAAFVYWVATMPESGDSKLCDQWVKTLLNSKDAAEVERAGWLTYHFDCEIRRRLP